MYVHVGARSIRYRAGQGSATLLWYHGDHPDQEGGLSSQVSFQCLFIKVSNSKTAKQRTSRKNSVVKSSICCFELNHVNLWLALLMIKISCWIHFLTHRYKGLLCLRELPPADGESCVKMLHKLGPVKSGSYQLGVSKVCPLSAQNKAAFYKDSQI